MGLGLVSVPSEARDIAFTKLGDRRPSAQSREHRRLRVGWVGAP